MTWDYEASAGENSERELPALARGYFASGRDAMDKTRSPRELHRFRIKTKRFRYALEMFQPVYGAAMEPRLERLQQLQRILGKISDLYTIRKLLKDDYGCGKELYREGRKRIEEFREHWRTVFDAPGEEEAWVATLNSTMRADALR